MLRFNYIASRIVIGMMASSALCTASYAQGPEDSAAAGENSDSRRLDTVTVTALKRETTLQNTAEAITVLSDAVQPDKGNNGLDDLRSLVPNLNFASTSNTSQLYIRGVGNTFLNAGGDPGVALYQDNAYISDQTTSNVNFFDVDRIEVLRGPQGALYGRNSTGGAISIMSALPTSEFEGKVTGVLGDYGRRELDGYLSGPLGFAATEARLSYQIKQRDGFIDNRLSGQAGAPDDLNDWNSWALRFQTLTHLPGDGTFRFLVSKYDQDDNGDALGVTSTPGVEYAVETLFGAVPTDDPFSVEANVGKNEVNVTTVNAEWRQPIGDTDLTVTGNYRESEQFFQNDCDGTEVDNCRYVRENSSEDYYLDAHLAGPGDSRLRWLVGATALQFEIDQLNDVIFPFPLSYLDPTAPSTIPFDMRVFSGGNVEVESYAVYADLHLQFTDIWALTGQIRYQETEKVADELLRIDAFATDVPSFPNSLKNSRTPFKIGIEGQLNSDILIYANYSTAFKDGAINLGALQLAPVEPETVENYEAGFKSAWLDGSVQVNGAVFFNSYENLQISQLTGTVITLANVPESEINGAEIEILAMPVDGLRLNASIGYLDAQLNDFSNSRILPGLVGGSVEDLAGNRLPYVAEWSGIFGGEYTFQPVSGYDASLSANYAYHSRIYFNEYNDNYNSQPAVGVLDLSASFGPDSGNWETFVYVKNATDETVRTGSTIYSGLIGAARAVSYAPPRHFGIGATLSF